MPNPISLADARVALLERISPDWRCAGCEHDRFMVLPNFVDLMSRLELTDSAHIGSVPCIGLACMQCGLVSLHSVAIVDGTLHEGLAEGC